MDDVALPLHEWNQVSFAGIRSPALWIAPMGNTVNNIKLEPEEITDEKWSKQLEKYLEIEDPEVEADLIYHFDGKAVSG